MKNIFHKNSQSLIFALFIFFNLYTLRLFSQDTFHVAQKIINFKAPQSFQNGYKNKRLNDFIKSFTYGNNVTIAYYLKKEDLDRFNHNSNFELINTIKLFIPQKLIGKDLSNTSINTLYNNTIKSYLGDNFSEDQRKKYEMEFNQKLNEIGINETLTFNKPILLADTLINTKSFYTILANKSYLNNDQNIILNSIQSMIVKVVKGQIIFIIYQQELKNFSKDLKAVKNISLQILSGLY